MTNPADSYVSAHVPGIGTVMSHKEAKQPISNLLNALVGLNDALDETLANAEREPSVIIEMHPHAFRGLLFDIHAHVSPAEFMYGSEKPGEFKLLNVIFRPVLPEPRRG